VLRGHRGPVWSSAWSPGGSWVVSASDDRCMIVWDPRTGEAVARVAGHLHHINCVAWSPNGAWLASGSHDKTLVVWHAWADGLAEETTRIDSEGGNDAEDGDRAPRRGDRRPGAPAEGESSVAKISEPCLGPGWSTAASGATSSSLAAKEDGGEGAPSKAAEEDGGEGAPSGGRSGPLVGNVREFSKS
jgi:WD40 repeat protein